MPKPAPHIDRQIRIEGAREHNLKGVAVSLPRDQLVVFTGVSGSGKSSLAFDTIFAEGQRKYMESLSAYARQFLNQMRKPDVERIEGLPDPRDEAIPRAPERTQAIKFATANVLTLRPRGRRTGLTAQPAAS